MKVSIIVPIFGVEKFIARCAESLLNQTLDDIELIFVNDCTQDSSMLVLESVLSRYTNRQADVIIINHEINKGLPAARNSGLEIASGEFIFHCDGDDYVETEMLELMYNAAIENDADLVWSDYYLTYEQSERYIKQPDYVTPFEALKGMLTGKLIYNVWNKIVRRQLYEDNNITFPTGRSMGEDMTMMMLMPAINKVAYVPKALYHYIRYNVGAITSQYTNKHLNALHNNVQRVTDYLRDIYGDSLSLELACMKLESKWTFLCDEDIRNKYNLWKQWFPEANTYILKNKYVSGRIRFVEWCAWKGMYCIVWVHYWIVIRFFYSLKYR